jgi:hypothetical protein
VADHPPPRSRGFMPATPCCHSPARRKRLAAAAAVPCKTDVASCAASVRCFRATSGRLGYPPPRPSLGTNCRRPPERDRPPTSLMLPHDGQRAAAAVPARRRPAKRRSRRAWAQSRERVARGLRRKTARLEKHPEHGRLVGLSDGRWLGSTMRPTVGRRASGASRTMVLRPIKCAGLEADGSPTCQQHLAATALQSTEGSPPEMHEHSCPARANLDVLRRPPGYLGLSRVHDRGERRESPVVASTANRTIHGAE